MNTSRLLRFVITASLVSGINTAQADGPSVHLYNWYDFISPETSKDFTKETGVPFVMDPFDSADVLQSKLMVGHTGYDVAVATSNILPALAQAGVLQELDREKLSNWKHLNPDILAKLQVNDPGNRYAVPYLWGTTGIGYDVKKVKAALGDNAPVDSWDLVFKEENIKKLKKCGVAMLDSPSEIVSIALHYLGLPHNSKNPDDYAKAQALLLKIRPYVRYFDSSKFGEDLANGNVCLVVGWAGSINDARVAGIKAKNGREIAYSLPREGALLWSENLVLLKDAPHPEQGEMLINYMMRPEVIAKTSNYTGYPSANKDATALIRQDLRENPGIYPDEATIAKMFPLEPLPLNLERIRTRVWTKVKSGV